MNLKGTSLIEYAIMIAAVLLAVLFMSTYVLRAVQGRMKDDLEKIGLRYEYGTNTVSRSITNTTRNSIINVIYTNRIIDGERKDILKTTADVFIDRMNRTSEERLMR